MVCFADGFKAFGIFDSKVIKVEFQHIVQIWIWNTEVLCVKAAEIIFHFFGIELFSPFYFFILELKR